MREANTLGLCWNESLILADLPFKADLWALAADVLVHVFLHHVRLEQELCPVVEQAQLAVEQPVQML